MESQMMRDAHIPKSNVFCADNRKILSDSTYQLNYNTGKLNMSAHAQTQQAANERRIAAALPVTKVNIFPGHLASTLSNTSYELAFNKDKNEAGENSRPKDHCHLKPSCTHCMYEAILNSHHFRERTRARNASDADQNEALRGTHFTFGNDKVKHVTAYKDFTASMTADNKLTKMVSPPTDAEVLPSMPEARNTAQRSSLQTDFTYFGPKTNGDNRHRHTDNFNAIKTLHGCDSVGASIQGKRGKLLSRSMIDYIHPLHMRRPDNTPSMQRSWTNQTYQPRQDSIWGLSVRGDRCGDTESRQNFSRLPSISSLAFKRYYKGHISDNIR